MLEIFFSILRHYYRTFSVDSLLIKIFRSNAYVINGDRLRGIYDLELRTLERTGYDIVPVNLGKWEALQDYEKIPFLMQQVRLKEKALTL